MNLVLMNLNARFYIRKTFFSKGQNPLLLNYSEIKRIFIKITWTEKDVIWRLGGFLRISHCEKEEFFFRRKIAIKFYEKLSDMKINSLKKKTDWSSPLLCSEISGEPRKSKTLGKSEISKRGKILLTGKNSFLYKFNS